MLFLITLHYDENGTFVRRFITDKFPSCETINHFIFSMVNIQPIDCLYNSTMDLKNIELKDCKVVKTD